MGGAFKASKALKLGEAEMELLRMLAVLAGSVGLLRAAITTTESATTIKAVPLNDELEESLRQEHNDDYSYRLEESLRQEDEEEDKMSTTESESLGTIPTTSPSGLIEWAPYRGEDRRKKRKGPDFPKLRPVKG